MKAFLLAGGYGTRLRPITQNIPKCLVPIGGRPLLDYWLHSLESMGTTQIRINTHYLPEKVEDFVAKHPLKDKVELVYERELLGTLGTLRANKDFFEGDINFIAHADNFCITDWQAFLQTHMQRPSRCESTMMVFDTNDSSSCGMVSVDKHGVLNGYAEKPQGEWPTTLANGAVFLMSKRAIEHMFSLNVSANDLCRDYVPKAVGLMTTFHNTQTHIDIGTLKTLFEAENVIAQSTQKLSLSVGSR